MATLFRCIINTFGLIEPESTLALYYQILRFVNNDRRTTLTTSNTAPCSEFELDIRWVAKSKKLSLLNLKAV